MDSDQIDNIFTYHKPFGTQAERYERIREEARTFAKTLNELCPESREKGMAFTQLQSCVQFANASIAINEKVVAMNFEGGVRPAGDLQDDPRDRH